MSAPRRRAYRASPIRRRSTQAEVIHRREELFDIVASMRPMTVRQVYYQATVTALVDKTEAGYGKVQTDLVKMRRAGALPYEWIADNTRWQRKPRTFSSIEQALHDTARFYRKSLWDEAQAYVEVWLEKDALAGVVNPITDMYDVPLMVSRGYASLSFLHTAATYMNSLDVPSYIYHFGDFDPSGQDAADKIEQTLGELAPDAEIHFERVAVTKEQIERLSLPSRPTKASDSRSRNFGKVSVELDAMKPDVLRGLVENVINRHLPPDQLRVLQEIERSEREALTMFAGTYRGARG